MLGNGVAITARRALPQIIFWWKKILHQNWYVLALGNYVLLPFPSSILFLSSSGLLLLMKKLLTSRRIVCHHQNLFVASY